MTNKEKDTDCDSVDNNTLSVYIPLKPGIRISVSVILDKGPGKGTLLKVKKADYYNNELVIVAVDESKND